MINSFRILPHFGPPGVPDPTIGSEAGSNTIDEIIELVKKIRKKLGKSK